MLLTLISLPLKSSVRSSPKRGNPSNSRIFALSAALGAWALSFGAGACKPPGAGWRIVTPPCADDVTIGTCFPFGLRGSGARVAYCNCRAVAVAPVEAAATARRARGIYGVYVVCKGAFAGCTGGGGIGPCRGGGSGSVPPFCKGEVFADGVCPGKGKAPLCDVGVSGGDEVVGVEGGESVLKREYVGVDVPEEEVEPRVKEEGIVSG